MAPTGAITGPEAHDHTPSASAPAPTTDGPQQSEYLRFPPERRGIHNEERDARVKEEVRPGVP